MSSAQRYGFGRRGFFLIALLLLLCGNVLYFAWFMTRTQNASADDIIVQKAYIVSRLLSDSAARHIGHENMSGLRGAVEEALKDQHLAAITILDKEGNILLENSAATPDNRLSTFETPIRLGKKNLGMLVARFYLPGHDKGTGAELRRRAAVQGGLFVFVSALAAIACRGRRCSRETVVAIDRAIPALAAPAVEPLCVADAEIIAAKPLSSAPLLPWHPVHTVTDMAPNFPQASVSPLPGTPALQHATPIVVRCGGNSRHPLLTRALRPYHPSPSYLENRLGFARILRLPEQPLPGTPLPRLRGMSVSDAHVVVPPAYTVSAPPAGRLMGTGTSFSHIPGETDPVFVSVNDKRHKPVDAASMTIDTGEDPSPFLAHDLVIVRETLREALSKLFEELHSYREVPQQMAGHQAFTDMQRRSGNLANYSGLLIKAGLDIITPAIGRYADGAAAKTENELPLLDSVQSLVTGVREAVNLLNAVNSNMYQRVPDQNSQYSGNICTAAAMAEESAVALQGHVLPAIGHALTAERDMQRKVSLLTGMMEQVTGSSTEMTRKIMAMKEAAEAARFRAIFGAPGIVEPAGIAADKEVVLLAERIQEMVSVLEVKLQVLDRVADEAALLGRSAMSDMETLTTTMQQAGYAAEDAAVASALWGQLLRDRVSGADLSEPAHGPALETASMLAELQELETALTGKAAALALTATESRVQSDDLVSSLTVACESLRLANSFVTELGVSSSIELPSTGFPPDHGAEQSATIIGIAELLSDADGRLQKFLSAVQPVLNGKAPSASGPDPKGS